ncbi:MAG: hypothetical protein WDM90_15540 [Ferruginibacter sp.]
MKTLLSVLAFLLVLNVTHAQVKKIPGELKPLKREVVSRSTGQRGHSNVSIRVTLTTTEGNGETLNFISNTPIDKVEISFANIPNSKQISTYGNDIKQGFFYLESGAYKGGLAKGYLIDFFVKGFDKPVWVCALTAKK